MPDQHEQAASHRKFRHGDDLFGMARKVVVENEYRKHGVAGDQERNNPRVPAKQDQDSTCDFGENDQRQYKTWYAAGSHISKCAAVAENLADSGRNEEGGDQDATDQLSCVLQFEHGSASRGNVGKCMVLRQKENKNKTGVRVHFKCAGPLESRL